MIRTCVFALALTLAVVGSRPTVADETSEKQAAELKWAKGVASDFFDAAFNGNLEAAESLIDSSLKELHAKEGESRLREWLNNGIAIQRFRNPVIETGEIAPDQDEASFKGKFQARGFTYLFSLRVCKDKESGKWRVCFFHFRNQQE